METFSIIFNIYCLIFFTQMSKYFDHVGIVIIFKILTSEKIKYKLYDRYILRLHKNVKLIILLLTYKHLIKIKNPN